MTVVPAESGLPELSTVVDNVVDCRVGIKPVFFVLLHEAEAEERARAPGEQAQKIQQTSKHFSSHHKRLRSNPHPDPQPGIANGA
jgi:hypothetical protein